MSRVESPGLSGTRRALVICAPSPREVGSAPAGTVKVVRALLDRGWTIDILAFRWKVGSPDDELFCAMLDGSTVIEQEGFFGKPSGWVPRAVRTGRRLLARHRYDVLVSFAHMTWTHVVALFLKRSSGLPWVGFFSDPWTNHELVRWSPPRRLVERRFEWRTYVEASALVFTNAGMRDWMLAPFPGRREALSKAFVIPYCFDRRFYGAPDSRVPNGRIAIRHMGAIPPGGYPTGLLDALGMLQEEHADLAARLVFEFFGSYRPHHAEHVHRLGLEGLVRFLPPVTYKESLRLMKESDVLLLLGMPPHDFNGLGNVTLHLKMTDYLGAERPVFALAGAGSPADDALRETGGVCSSEDPRAVKEALVRFLSNARPPDAEIRDRFSRGRVAVDWEAVLAHACRQGQR